MRPSWGRAAAFLALLAGAPPAGLAPGAARAQSTTVTVPADRSLVPQGVGGGDEGEVEGGLMLRGSLRRQDVDAPPGPGAAGRGTSRRDRFPV